MEVHEDGNHHDSWFMGSMGSRTFPVTTHVGLTQALVRADVSLSQEIFWDQVLGNFNICVTSLECLLPICP